MAGLKEILSWFEKNKYPTQEQFKESWTSFWHKSEKMPMEQVVGLQDELSDKALKSDLNAVETELKDKASIQDIYQYKTKYYNNSESLNENRPNPSLGEIAWAGNPFPGTTYIANDEGKWLDTGVVPEFNADDDPKRELSQWLLSESYWPASRLEYDLNGNPVSPFTVIFPNNEKGILTIDRDYNLLIIKLTAQYKDIIAIINIYRSVDGALISQTLKFEQNEHL